MAELAGAVVCRAGAVAAGDRVLKEELEFGSGDGEQGELVVELERILKIETGDITCKFASRRIRRRDAGNSEGTDSTDRVANAAAVFQRDFHGGVDLLGIPEVGIGGEVSEVGFLLADVGSATFEIDRRFSEDDSVLGVDDRADLLAGFGETDVTGQASKTFNYNP